MDDVPRSCLMGDLPLEMQPLVDVFYETQLPGRFVA